MLQISLQILNAFAILDRTYAVLQSCLTVLVGTGGMFLFASCCCACFELRSQIIVSVGFFAADPHYVKKHPVCAEAKLTYLARPGSQMALIDGTNGETSAWGNGCPMIPLV